MDSLLANYGSSDDEGDEKPKQQPPPPPLARASLFASLPSPSLSDDGHTIHTPSLRSSLFASLPRPKSAGEDVLRSEEQHKSVDPAAPHETSHRTQSKTGPSSYGAEKPSGNDALPKSVSLFSALPPPKSTRSSLLAPLPAQSQPASSKRIVEIRPAIDISLLHDDGDDNVEPQTKRLATGSVTTTKASGLAALLPKPKNSGSALGSGFASGHHGTLDLGTTGNPLGKRTEVGSREAAPWPVHDAPALQHEHHSHFAGADLEQDAARCPGSTSAGAWGGHDGGADLQKDADAMPSSAPYYSSVGFHNNVGDTSTQDYYGVSEDHLSEMQAYDGGSYEVESNAADPLAHMLMKDRRKKPVNVVEVKQADLTATKVREDQLRSTGIAFGPAYKPTSSNKNKPSKLHRRKHQIGSLYYDMKQKEMELAERRSRGYVTKSVTQAKYGW